MHRWADEGWAISMFSLDLGRTVSLPGGGGGRQQSDSGVGGDGSKIAFSSSRSGDSEIWVSDANGGGRIALHR